MTSIDINTRKYSPLTWASDKDVPGADTLIFTGPCRLMFIASSGDDDSSRLIFRDGTNATGTPAYSVRESDSSATFIDFGPAGVQMDDGIFAEQNGAATAVVWVCGYIA